MFKKPEWFANLFKEETPVVRNINIISDKKGVNDIYMMYHNILDDRKYTTYVGSNIINKVINGCKSHAASSSPTRLNKNTVVIYNKQYGGCVPMAILIDDRPVISFILGWDGTYNKIKMMDNNFIEWSSPHEPYSNSKYTVNTVISDNGIKSDIEGVDMQHIHTLIHNAVNGVIKKYNIRKSILDIQEKKGKELAEQSKITNDNRKKIHLQQVLQDTNVAVINLTESNIDNNITLVLNKEKTGYIIGG
jgi:hypothetical protein